ncbi:MAG: PAS domain S-box protein [Ferruginibacter sp.]
MNTNKNTLDLRNIFLSIDQIEHFIETFLDATDDMVVVFDTDLRIMVLNKSCENNFGVVNAEAKGKYLFDIFPYVQGSQSHMDLLKAFRGETVSNGSRKSVDNKFYVQNKLIPLKTSGGEVYAVMAIAKDVSFENNTNTVINNAKKKIAEQDDVLIDKKKFVDSILNASVDVIMLINSERELIALNKFATHILEPFSTDLLGKKMEEILPHIKNTEAWDKFYEALSGKKVAIKEYKSLVNEKYWEINFSPIKNNQVIEAVMVICHDVTDVIKTKRDLENSNTASNKIIEELRSSEDRYHRMVEEVQDYAIILLDANGVIQNWNKGAERIKGYKAGEIIGKSFTAFYTDEDRKNNLPMQLLDMAKKEGKALHEGWRVKKEGKLFWGSISLTALHDNENKLIGFSKVTRDLTLQKIANDNQQKQAYILIEKNRMLEKLNKELQSFAYVASHDLQEPLRKIQFFSNLIVQKETEHLSDTGKDHFRRMQEAAKRMQTLIEDLLSFSRTNDGEKIFVKTDLKKIVDEVIYEMREAINEKSAKIIISDIMEVEVVPFQFRQLIQNLLSNSLKFSKQDDTVVIKITAEEVIGAESVDITLKHDIKYCKLTIADNGIGFEEQYNQRIFELFQRLHGKHEYKGTGIGLAICKKIVENHNGFIMAKSEPASGASFVIYLPLIQPRT